MSIVKKIRLAHNRRGLQHIGIRGLEFAALQTCLTSKLYHTFAEPLYNYKYSFELREYGIDADPFELRSVDPTDISRISGRDGLLGQQRFEIGAVAGGDWDQRDPQEFHGGLYNARHLSDTLLGQALIQRFEEGRDWDDTEFITTIKNWLREGEVNEIWSGCQTPEDVDSRCSEIEELYERMRTEGYRTQDELACLRLGLDEPFGFFNNRLHEVNVDIARDGELLLVGGRHRVTLAQILELDEIPVLIAARHREWVEGVSD